MARDKISKKPIAFLIFVIVLLFGVVAVQVSNLYVENQAVEKEALAVRQELEDAILLQEELYNQKNFMLSDDYIERLARERLNLIKPDEIKVVPQDE
jgi:cell division protein DivIC